MRWFLITGSVITVVAVWYLFSKDQDAGIGQAPSGTPARGYDMSEQPRPRSNPIPSVSETHRPKIPREWVPFSSVTLDLGKDAADVLGLTPEQVTKLTALGRVLNHDIRKANGELEFFSDELKRKPGDRRSQGKAAEFAVFIPAQRKPWIAAEMEYKTSLESILGKEKAEIFTQHSSGLFNAVTGGFGRYPRIATVDCILASGQMHYRWTIRSGPGAVGEVLGTGFAPEGRSTSDLEKLFTGTPESSAGETFTEVPSHLSRMFELAGGGHGTGTGVGNGKGQ